MKPDIIAIDGPAASGKSTLAERLAAYLDYMFFDTGIMYRVVTLAALRKLGATDNESEVAHISETVVIDVRPAGDENRRKACVFLDGADVTGEIRSTEVNAHVSQVSAYPDVRRALTEQQRRIGLRGSIVMVGRDIGTVVLPEADVKIYLDASAEERARRRFEEVKRRGESENYETILQSIQQRDRIDSTRAVAPLVAASDAIRIDTDPLTEEEVLQEAIRIIESK